MSERDIDKILDEMLSSETKNNDNVNNLNNSSSIFDLFYLFNPKFYFLKKLFEIKSGEQLLKGFIRKYLYSLVVAHRDRDIEIDFLKKIFKDIEILKVFKSKYSLIDSDYEDIYIKDAILQNKESNFLFYSMETTYFNSRKFFKNFFGDCDNSDVVLLRVNIFNKTIIFFMEDVDYHGDFKVTIFYFLNNKDKIIFSYYVSIIIHLIILENNLFFVIGNKPYLWMTNYNIIIPYLTENNDENIYSKLLYKSLNLIPEFKNIFKSLKNLFKLLDFISHRLKDSIINFGILLYGKPGTGKTYMLDILNIIIDNCLICKGKEDQCQKITDARWIDFNALMDENHKDRIEGRRMDGKDKVSILIFDEFEKLYEKVKDYENKVTNININFANQKDNEKSKNGENKNVLSNLLYQTSYGIKLYTVNDLKKIDVDYFCKLDENGEIIYTRPGRVDIALNMEKIFLNNKKVFVGLIILSFFRSSLFVRLGEDNFFKFVDDIAKKINLTKFNTIAEMSQYIKSNFSELFGDIEIIKKYRNDIKNKIRSQIEVMVSNMKRLCQNKKRMR